MHRGHCTYAGAENWVVSGPKSSQRIGVALHGQALCASFVPLESVFERK